MCPRLVQNQTRTDAGPDWSQCYNHFPLSRYRVGLSASFELAVDVSNLTAAHKTALAGALNATMLSSLCAGLISTVFAGREQCPESPNNERLVAEYAVVLDARLGDWTSRSRALSASAAAPLKTDGSLDIKGFADASAATVAKSAIESTVANGTEAGGQNDISQTLSAELDKRSGVLGTQLLFDLKEAAATVTLQVFVVYEQELVVVSTSTTTVAPAESREEKASLRPGFVAAIALVVLGVLGLAFVGGRVLVVKSEGKRKSGSEEFSAALVPALVAQESGELFPGENEKAGDLAAGPSLLTEEWSEVVEKPQEV